ncbi:MAG TPA: YciI family protein [Puia sp.]|nr:YciI family protein [Puia sp.]
MKEYLFIFRGGDDPGMRESPAMMQAHLMKWKHWIDAIAAEGKYITGQPLTTAGKVVYGKKIKITDGPYAEGKEMIGGYFLIKAGSLDEAVEMSKGCPGFEYDGSVEVREIMQVTL